ncbi:MAG: PQQ-dependent sugar dehydrogenase [Pseudomonadota bacterium]
MTFSLRLLSLSLAGLSLAACSEDVSSATAATAASGGTLSALPDGAKGGGDKSLQKNLADPAPAGSLALDVETVADGLVNPWDISFLPDGDILVTEREGRIRIIRNGVLLDEPVANAPKPLVWNQSGYFDILPHPDFIENRTVFFSFAHGDKDGNALRVISATLRDDALSDIRVIYDVKPLKDTGHHYGGKLVIGPDEKLYISSGEGSRYKEKSQDLTSSFGAIIRINQDGSIPTDNPAFKNGALPELFTKGHRNPQGLAYDPVTDTMWAHEHGARGGDEINEIVAGANYGWPVATYGIDYNGARISPFTEFDGTKLPFKYWTPSIAPSGLAVYRGGAFPADWQGDLLVGALAGKALHRVDLEDGVEVKEERYLVDLGARIRDVRVGPHGAIWVTTESRSGEPTGRLLRLTPAS